MQVLLVLLVVSARKKPSATAFHQGHKLRGDFAAISPEGCAGGSWGDAESGKEKQHQSLANSHGSALGMGRGTQFFADILPRQPVGLTDFFLIVITVL